MRNMVIFLIVLGVLLLASAFILCVLVFHPNTTSIILGLAVPFIIFMLIRKKLVQALKIDETSMEDEKKNERLANFNLDNPVPSNRNFSNEPLVTVNQNRDKLKDLFKKKSSKPSDEMKQNDFSILISNDKYPGYQIQHSSLYFKLNSGYIKSKEYSILYPEPFSMKTVRNFLKDLFHLK